jgi:hypothetical protein
MLTYTSARNLLGPLSSDSSAANLTLLDTLHNEFIREVVSLKPWPFRDKTRTFSTNTANIHYLPADCGKVNTITVTICSTKYTPKVIKDRETWDRLTQSTTTSNTPESVFVFDNFFSFYPAPSSATTDAGLISFKRLQKDLSIADYTAGTILSIANGATTVTGNTPSWTVKMAGRWIRITDSNTANTGDGEWYEIASVTSSTVLELVTPYNGTTISAGTAAYTIGQTSIIPEDFQMVPIYRTLEMYFTAIMPEETRAAQFKGLYAENVKRMQNELSSNLI